MKLVATIEMVTITPDRIATQARQNLSYECVLALIIFNFSVCLSRVLQFDARGVLRPRLACTDISNTVNKHIQNRLLTNTSLNIFVCPMLCMDRI